MADDVRATLGRLYLVATPRAGMGERDFLDRIDAALAGGVDVVQLRCKDEDDLAHLRLAERVAELARRHGAPFFVNDRPDVARDAAADGVHLGQRDLSPARARAIHPGALIGRSTHGLGDLDRALEERADYIGVGPIWATPTKPGRPPVGLDLIRAVAARRPALPWFAIGGITPDNLAAVVTAGATRVAVVRAILDAPDPAAAAAHFQEVLRARRHHQPDDDRQRRDHHPERRSAPLP